MSDAVADAVQLREAVAADLPQIVALLAADPLGATRECAVEPLPEGYVAAFRAIEADANCQLLVAERAGRIVGTLQLDFIPGLSRQGMWRAQVEAVRVAASERGRGLGERMLREAIARARAHGCGLVQLSTDKTRADAHRFYARLGFVASHEGMKLALV